MKFQSGMNAQTVPPPERDNSLPTARHAIDCESALAFNQYDTDKCPRCAIIQKVVHLRRRNIKNGSTVQEYLTAKKLGDALIIKHGLTRGEVYDREYPEAEIPQTTGRRKREVY